MTKPKTPAAIVATGEIATELNAQDLDQVQDEIGTVQKDASTFLQTESDAAFHISSERERQTSLNVVQQLFRCTESAFVYPFAILTAKKTLAIFQAIIMRQNTPESNSGKKNQLIWVASNIDANKHLNAAGKTVFGDSNHGAMKMFTTRMVGNSKNPLNAMFVHGTLTEGLLPSSMDITDKAMRRECQIDMFNLLQAYNDITSDQEMSPAERAANTVEIYNLYVEGMNEKAARGLFTVSHVIMANKNGLTPHIGVESNTKSDNDFLKTSVLLGNDQFRMTYVPVVNIVSGYMAITADETNPLSNIPLGMKRLNLADKGEDKNRYVMAKNAVVSDNFGNHTNIIAKVEDSLFQQTRGNGQAARKRSESFAETTMNFDGLFVTNGKLRFQNLLENGTPVAAKVASVLIDTYSVLPSKQIGSTVTVNDLNEQLDGFDDFDVMNETQLNDTKTFDMTSAVKGGASMQSADADSVADALAQANHEAATSTSSIL